MARFYVVALLLFVGCDRSKTSTAPTAAIIRLPPVTADDQPVSEPAPRGRITLSEPADTPAERQALGAVIRWLDDQSTKPYDVELSIHVRDGQPTTVFVVHVAGRDDQDRPWYSVGGHCLVEFDGDGNVTRLVGGA